MAPLLHRWKEFHRSFTHTPEAVKLVWQTNRWATLGLGFLTLAGALLPASQAWVGKLIVDGVVASIQRGADASRDSICSISSFLAKITSIRSSKFQVPGSKLFDANLELGTWNLELTSRSFAGRSPGWVTRRARRGRAG